MGEMAKMTIATLITFLAVAVAWTVATGPDGLPPSALPPPSDLMDAMNVALVRGTLYPHIAFTVQGALFGLLVGVALGLLLGGLVAIVPVLEDFLLPVVVALQSVPKIAVAPLIVAYMGFGLGSKVFTAALLSFFPIFIAMVRGLRSVDPQILDLYRASSASRLHVLMNVRIPAAALFVFAGLKVAVLLSLIGCIVSEFIASSKGLGFIIKSRSQEFDVSMMFVAIIVLSAIGVIGTMIVQGVQNKVVFWHRKD
jgi:NitT/TauT family transport system permease protein